MLQGKIMNIKIKIFFSALLIFNSIMTMQEQHNPNQKEQTYWQSFSDRMPSWLTKRTVIFGVCTVTALLCAKRLYASKTALVKAAPTNTVSIQLVKPSASSAAPTPAKQIISTIAPSSSQNRPLKPEELIDLTPKITQLGGKGLKLIDVTSNAHLRCWMYHQNQNQTFCFDINSKECLDCHCSGDTLATVTVWPPFPNKFRQNYFMKNITVQSSTTLSIQDIS